MVLVVSLICFVSCSGRDSKKSDSSSDSIDDSAAKLTVEYESGSIDEGYVLIACKYFNAIINRDVSSYKETLFPYYAERMEEYLQSEYGYGMEKSFENLAQNLQINNGKFTTLSLSYSGDEAVEDYLSRLENLLGDGFSQESSEKFDEGCSILFTINARYDGYEEDFSVVSENELICVKSGDSYYVFG